MLLSSCQSDPFELKIISGNAIGTTYSIRYLDNKERTFEADIDSLIKAVNSATSTYIHESDISKINAGDTTVVVNQIFKDIFFKCERIHSETDGWFDPTIGVLVNAWGFGPENTESSVDSTQIASLLKFVGFNKVTLKNDRIRKKYPEIYFDFNAIGKGYLVDMVGRMFESHSIANYMVEIGGEIRARGVNQKGVPWKIAIENPNYDGSRSFATTISLSDKSIATSGNYRKFRMGDNGEKYVHTINPKTGFAYESNLLSASVISNSDCADVDGYATAFMAMGFERTKAFVNERTDLEVFLIYSNEKGELNTYRSEKSGVLIYFRQTGSNSPFSKAYNAIFSSPSTRV